MTSRLALFLLLPALLLLAIDQAQGQTGAAVVSERRVALVIGNNAYRQVPKLANAVPDAKAMSREFKALGFEVIEAMDADQRSMKSAIRDFAKRISAGGVGAFFYAGHGVQEGGNNYLLPVDIDPLTDPSALNDEAVELNGDLMSRIGPIGAKFTLLIIDACRDNPFPRRAGRSVGGTRGLTAATNTPEGMIVVYSAGVGQQALDRLGANDKDPNSLFTREFVREMRTPGIEVAEMVRNVRKRVKDKAASVQHEQTPAIYIQADRFYFIAPAPAAPPPQVAPALPSSEDVFWAQLDAKRPCEYQAYLDQFPQGKFAALARIRVKECRQEAAVATQRAGVVAAAAPPPVQTAPAKEASVPAVAAGAVREDVATQPAPQASTQMTSAGAQPPTTSAAVSSTADKTPSRPAAPTPTKASSPTVATAAAAAPLAAPDSTSKAPAPQAQAKEERPATGAAPPVKAPERAKVAAADLAIELPGAAKIAKALESSSKTANKPAPATPASNGKQANVALPFDKGDRPAETQVALAAAIKAVPPVPATTTAGNLAQPSLHPGDQWVLRRIDLWTKNEVTRLSQRLVSQAGDTLVLEVTPLFPGGADKPYKQNAKASTWALYDRRILEGDYLPLQFPLAIGKTWDYRFRRTRDDDQGVTDWKVNARIEGWEKIQVPGGSFDTLKVVHEREYESVRGSSHLHGQVTETLWYAPTAKRWVRREYVDRGGGRINEQFREELVEFALQ